MANLINCTVPFVTQLPHLDMFFVSGVRVGDLEVVAPSMEYTIYREGPMKGRVVYKPTGVHSVKLKSGGKEFVRFAVTNEYGAQMANIQPELIGDCFLSEEKKAEAKLKARMKALAGKYPGVETVAEMISLKVEGDALEVDFAKAWKNFGIPPRSKLSWKRLGLLSTRRMYALRCR
eukprot:36403_1